MDTQFLTFFNLIITTLLVVILRVYLEEIFVDRRNPLTPYLLFAISRRMPTFFQTSPNYLRLMIPNAI
jgi:hypothetical protein